MIREFGETLKTKIAIKNFDKNSEPKRKKELYRMIEEEMQPFIELEKQKAFELKGLKQNNRELSKRNDILRDCLYNAPQVICQFIRDNCSMNAELESVLYSVEIVDFTHKFIKRTAEKLRENLEKESEDDIF